jgi:hypothetical protein
LHVPDSLKRIVPNTRRTEDLLLEETNYFLIELLNVVIDLLDCRVPGCTTTCERRNLLELPKLLVNIDVEIRHLYHLLKDIAEVDDFLDTFLAALNLV